MFVIIPAIVVFQYKCRVPYTSKKFKGSSHETQIYFWNLTLLSYTEVCLCKSETFISIDLPLFNNWNICWLLKPMLIFLLSSTLANNNFSVFFVLNCTEHFSWGWTFSFIVRLVNGDVGVEYHKVTFCIMKCIQDYEKALVIVWIKYSLVSWMRRRPVYTWTRIINYKV